MTGAAPWAILAGPLDRDLLEPRGRPDGTQAVHALLHALAYSAPSRAADRTAREARVAADVAAAAAAAAAAALATLRSRWPDPDLDLADLQVAASLADRYEGLWAASEMTALRAAEAARSIRHAADTLRLG